MNSRVMNAPYELFTVGFDELFNQAMKPSAPKYPPYNILKTGETSYLIEMAVAGFSENDLEVNLKGNVLTIKGSNPNTDMEYDYIHRGIGTRDFERTFTVAEDVIVENAQNHNGILQIRMVKHIPEHKRERKIPINGAEPKQFLQE